MILPPGTQDEARPASYRFRRGSKLADMPPVSPDAPVPPLSSFDGPFQLAEFLSLKVRHDPHDIKGLVEVPTDSSKAADKHVWIYEHLRRIPIDATPLVTQLLTLCNRETCPEMKADEWQYLCVAHGGEGTNKCCAIDYILHALDSTTSLLSSSSFFPSRLQIPHASLAHFPSLFRRLSRIFSHSYYHHREAFATAEAETSLYARFVALCERYELVGSNLLIIPQEGYEVLAQEDDLEDHRVDDDEEGDWDDDVTADTGDRDDSGDDSPRGRDKDDNGGAGRSHSLGRHPAPPFQSPGKWSSSPVQPANKGKPAPAQASESLSPPSTRAQLDGHKESEEPQPPTILPGKGRGTLSRGKAPRAANLWTAEDVEGEGKDVSDGEGKDVSDAEGKDLSDAEGKDLSPQMGMARKESVDSVVYVGRVEGDSSSAGDAEQGEGGSKESEEASARPEASPAPEASPEVPISSAATSEPLPIPQSASKPRTPSPQKLMTPPKPPAAASPGKASPAPALASPTLTSLPTLSSAPVVKPAAAAPESSDPLAEVGTNVVDLGVSPGAPSAPSAPSAPTAETPPAATATDEAPITDDTTPAPVPVHAPVSPSKLGPETTTSLEVAASDLLSTSPKSELQARPGSLSVSPKSISKRNSKTRRDKGKKGQGPPKSPSPKSEDS